MNKIVLATNNPGKTRELNALLADLPIEVLPQSAFDVPEIEETGLSFVENAILKARNAARHTGLPAIADDSGLVVHALAGAPGIRSARYAGAKATDQDNLEKLLADLRHVPEPQRQAHFHCLLVYLRHPEDPAPVIAEGVWEGVITHAPKGEHGFGYDPVFFVPSQGRTAAELPLELKNRLSHRAQALNRGLSALRREYGFGST